MSIGNRNDQIVVGWICGMRNRPCAAAAGNPGQNYINLARDICEGRIPDPTGGANHFYSPYSMPKEGEGHKCKPRGNYDCAGGLEKVPGMSTKTYKPGWATTNTFVSVPGTRD